MRQVTVSDTPVKIAKIAEDAPVLPLLWELQVNGRLWNQYPQRTIGPDSPHREVDDIWARYAAPEEIGRDGPHESVWYPCGSADAPIRALCRQLMALVHGTRLGGVLITRIRAGCRVLPHVDHGWHSVYYRKIAVQVQSAPGQRFCFEGESLETRPGDVYVFDNSFSHWVENPTEYDRITLIACIRSE